MGGSALYIETQGIKRGPDENGKPRGGGTLKATGNLRDVMKESSQIAYTVARARLADIDATNDYFDKTDIHMHVPEGATPKDGMCSSFASFDLTEFTIEILFLNFFSSFFSLRQLQGPSAGIAMVTSMLSLALGKPIRNDLAMTGEVSLTGKVLPVGGIKEKIMGGRRAGIKSIILPDANRRDYDEIPDYLKEGLDVHFAENYDTVYEIVFEYRKREELL